MLQLLRPHLYCRLSRRSRKSFIDPTRIRWRRHDPDSEVVTDLRRVQLEVRGVGAKLGLFLSPITHPKRDLPPAACASSFYRGWMEIEKANETPRSTRMKLIGPAYPDREEQQIKPSLACR